MEGRQQAMYALSALKSVVPGFDRAKLRNFGMTIGVRDTRKIIGRWVQDSPPKQFRHSLCIVNLRADTT